VIRYLVVLSQCWRENIFFSPWNVFCLGERGARNAVDRCATRGWLVTCGQTPWASMQWQACLRPHVTTRAHAEPSQKRPLSRVNVSHHTSTIGCDTPLAKKKRSSRLFQALQCSHVHDDAIACRSVILLNDIQLCASPAITCIALYGAWHLVATAFSISCPNSDICKRKLTSGECKFEAASSGLLLGMGLDSR
jgi:hypothetical protein